MKAKSKQDTAEAAQPAAAPAAADEPSSDKEGFFPKAQQLGSQAFADGTKVMEDASNFARTVQQISKEANSSLRDGMQHSPWAVLGGAATVGFVLGRGLTFGTSRTLLGMGGKLAMSMLLKRVTHGLVS